MSWRTIKYLAENDILEHEKMLDHITNYSCAPSVSSQIESIQSEN